MSECFEAHQSHLRQVFECNFGQSEVQLLGFIINSSGCRPPTDRVTAIENYTKPETICELRRFLGIINFNRRCIPNAAQLQAPLNDFLTNSRKNDKWKVPWTPEAENAFSMCKRSVSEARF